MTFCYTQQKIAYCLHITDTAYR